MKAIEVQAELQLNSPSGQRAFEGLQEFMSREESNYTESLQNTGHGGGDRLSEAAEPLSLLADVALAPPCGDQATVSCLEVSREEGDLDSFQLQLYLIMSKADDLQDSLVDGQGRMELEALTAAVRSFLYSCQPYFNQVEAAARSLLFHITPLPFDVYIRRVQLLDFSQQLCDRLEELVLSFASNDLLCLEETEPHSVSHFFIGQICLERLRLSTFLYCKPTPYLAHVDTGLFKRMRWNVDRLGDERQTDTEQGGENEEREAETEYYFLCYEDIRNTHTEVGGDSQGVSDCYVRMWSIGQWVQVKPDPDKEDICDWIMCDVPQASYQRLFLLGRDEPSSCNATDFLLQLLSQHATESH